MNGLSTCPITSYYDDNSGVPSTFSLGTFYECKKGSYNYEYIACQQRWRGSYRLESEAGGEAGFFYDGEQGKPRRYTFKCWGYSSPDLTYTVGKISNEWTRFPDILINNGDGTVLRITREMRPVMSADEKIGNNKLVW
jgi:hypothetical protein